MCCVGCCRNFNAVRLHTDSDALCLQLGVGICEVHVCSCLHVDFLCIHAWTCLQVFVFTDATGCTRSSGIWVLQSNASCYSQGPGEFCCAVTEQRRGREWWRVGVEISCVAHAARGEHQCQALGYSSVAKAALHIYQQQWFCICIQLSDLCRAPTN